jgi:ppGpp synthetase/RelA/SpoT-type nucleotidyltranferase
VASAKQIQKLGKRLRDGRYSPDDLHALDDYRNEFDDLLLGTSAVLNAHMRSAQIPCVISGRLKRGKSIIRKLQRPANHAMSLALMADLAGIRVIITDLDCQDRVASTLRGSLACERVIDYRETGQPYRAVHVIAHQDGRPIEIQVRTLAQQLWANESESFGESVKEGGGEHGVRDYLEKLCAACRCLDLRLEVSELDSHAPPLMHTRRPLSVRLPRLRRLFDASQASLAVAERSFIVIYDNRINALSHIYSFLTSDREYSLAEYRRLYRELDDDRYEALILNSQSQDSLAVTHPRFFPEL